ncbi:uncharacterized protein LOC142597711 [Dermatophagoides farinae]
MSKKIFIVYFVAIMLFVAQFQFPMVQAGRSKKSMMIGVALGAAIARSQHHDLKLLHVLIPLRLAAEAWRQMGKHHHHHFDLLGGHHHHHDDYHHGHGYYRRRR